MSVFARPFARTAALMVAAVTFYVLAHGCAHHRGDRATQQPPERFSGTLQAEGGPLYYEVAGRGHPLVLIHAGIADHRMWDDQFEVFARRYRVVRYDTRGYGRSPVAEGLEFSNRQDLHELMRHLGMTSVYVVGVSRGGQIAVDFTLEHPDEVDALITVGAGVGGAEYQPTGDEAAAENRFDELLNRNDYEGLADLSVRLWVDGLGQPEDRVDSRVREKVRRMVIENYRNNPAEGEPITLNPPAAGRLSEIRVPTLVVVGDLDTPGAHHAAEILAKGIPGARKVILTGTAHLPNMERPEEFNRVVLDFLKDL